MSELDTVLQAFHEATNCQTALWRQPDDGGLLVVESAAPPGSGPPWFVPPPAAMPTPFAGRPPAERISSHERQRQGD